MEDVDEAIDVVEGVVERHRGDTDHVGLAPVTEHTCVFQFLEDPLAVTIRDS